MILGVDELVCNHHQKAAEKSLKMLLVHNQRIKKGWDITHIKVTNSRLERDYRRYGHYGLLKLHRIHLYK